MTSPWRPSKPVLSHVALCRTTSVKIIHKSTAADAGAAAATIIATIVRRHPRPVIGLATGSSPLPLYDALVKENLDLSGAQGFALDEYVGLPDGDARSYAHFIETEVIERLGMSPDLVHVPRAGPLEDGAGTLFENAIRQANGIDVQILGIGSNGHIGFNEPGSSFSSRTRVVTLAESTRASNARFFASPEDVPRKAITQGLATIFEARHLLLIAHGEGKASAVQRAIHGPISQDFPASMIQFHPSVTVVLDHAASSKLTPQQPDNANRK